MNELKQYARTALAWYTAGLFFGLLIGGFIGSSVSKPSTYEDDAEYLIEYLVRYSYSYSIALYPPTSNYHSYSSEDAKRVFKLTQLIRLKAPLNATTFEIGEAVRDYWREKDWLVYHALDWYNVDPREMDVIFYSRTFSESVDKDEL